MADAALTQELVESGQKLVHALAQEVHRKFHSKFEYDDLVAYGQLGLAGAASDFDTERGVRFTTFAYYRVRGAIYEGVSKLSGTTRAQYRRMKQACSANDVLERGPHREIQNAQPGLREDAAWLTSVSSQLTGAYLLTHCNLGEHVDSIEADDELTPELQTELAEIRERIRAVIEDLPEEARLLIEFVYFKNETLQSAATKLNISKSWASRLHARTLQYLASSLKSEGITTAGR